MTPQKRGVRQSPSSRKAVGRASGDRSTCAQNGGVEKDARWTSVQVSQRRPAAVADRVGAWQVFSHYVTGAYHLHSKHSRCMADVLSQRSCAVSSASHPDRMARTMSSGTVRRLSTIGTNKMMGIESSDKYRNVSAPPCAPLFGPRVSAVRRPFPPCFLYFYHTVTWALTRPSASDSGSSKKSAMSRVMQVVGDLVLVMLRARSRLSSAGSFLPGAGR